MAVLRFLIKICTVLALWFMIAGLVLGSTFLLELAIVCAAVPVVMLTTLLVIVHFEKKTIC